jgi:hypothetical protein
VPQVASLASGQSDVLAQLTSARQLVSELQGQASGNAGTLLQKLGAVSGELEMAQSRLVVLEEGTAKWDAKVRCARARPLPAVPTDQAAPRAPRWRAIHSAPGPGAAGGLGGRAARAAQGLGGQRRPAAGGGRGGAASAGGGAR